MRYVYYRDLGSSYSDERFVTNFMRLSPTVWKHVETKLKTAILDLAKVDPSLDPVTFQPRPVTSHAAKSNVQQKAAFFQNSIQKAAPTQIMGHRDKFAQKARAIRTIENCREWLRREGASADAQGNVDIGAMTPTVVMYDLQAAQQNLTQVIFENGLLYTETNGHRTLLDTTEMVTHASGPGFGIYVMSVQGNLHVASHVVGQYHHSSLLAGGRVAGAGEIMVKKGEVKIVSNKSGHYIPEAVHFFQVLHQLNKKGVSQNYGIKFYWYDTVEKNTKDEYYSSLPLFRASQHVKPEYEYELSKLLRYSHHFFPGGTFNSSLDNMGWRWREDPSEEPGFYRKDNKKKVPHKEVRQFLKDHNFMPTTRADASDL